MIDTWKRHQSGQSAVLLAFMILVIVAMVGLSVDVSNAYGQQRRVQSIANAGAIAGMASAIANNTNNAVWTDVQRALKSNRVKVNKDYTYSVDYFLDDGTIEPLGSWNGSASTVANGNSYPPANLERIQVTLTERIKTKFASVVGRPTLGVSANGVACFGDYGYGVYPLGVPQSLRQPTYSSGKETAPGHRIYLSNGQELPSSDSRWGKWGTDMIGMTIRIPVASGQSDFVSGVHVPWLNWGGNTQTVDGTTYTESSGKKGTDALTRAFTVPGTLQEGFLEAIAADNAKPNTRPIRTLQRGDWISGEAGARAALKDRLDILQYNQTKIMLPMYDATGNQNGSGASYHIVNMGLFTIRGFELTSGTKYIDLVYHGDAKASPTACGSDFAVSPSNPKQFTIKGDVLNNRVWRTITSSAATTYDIVLVMDTSESMRMDWSNRDVADGGYKASNARINDAKKVIQDFVRDYDLSSDKGDPDTRIAFVTYSGSSAVVQAGFQPACASILISSDCGDKSSKWPLIQTKAAAMIPGEYRPGPIAFETVETLLKNKRTPPVGKSYAQIVILATDGVFNVCGNDAGERTCPYGQLTPREGSATNNDVLYNTAYNAVSGRPIWQAQQGATRIKNSGASIFIVAITPTCKNNYANCFNPAGLPDMSSGSGYFFQATDSGALERIYKNIHDNAIRFACVPGEVTQSVAGATVVLTKPDNPTWLKQTTTNGSGMFEFGQLFAGQYILKIEPSVSIKSPEDGLTRTYSRTRNGRSLSEEGQASVYVNPLFPRGAKVTTQLLVSLPFDENGSPNNGCTMPAP